MTYDIQQVSDEAEGVRAFNNDAEIVYPDYVLPEFDFHTFVWKAGTTTDISNDIDPNAYYVEVSGLNDRGDMVGMHSGDTIASFLYRDGVVTPIEPFQDEDVVYVRDVNNCDVVVGYAMTAGDQSVAFSWHRGQATVLPPLPGSTAASPKAINDDGIVVGRDASGFAVMWRVQTPVMIPVPAGTESSEAVDINDRGEVILQGRVNGQNRAMYSRGGHSRVLPLLNDAQNSSAVGDINEWGTIVGSTAVENPGGVTRVATLWRGNEVVDLNTLLSDVIPQESRPLLTSASFINDRGQIVATGPAGTFLLTPHIGPQQ